MTNPYPATPAKYGNPVDLPSMEGQSWSTLAKHGNPVTCLVWKAAVTKPGVRYALVSVGRIWEFPMQDDSWEYEIEEFYKDITLNREPDASLEDAKQVHRVIQKIYRKSGYDFS